LELLAIGKWETARFALLVSVDSVGSRTRVTVFSVLRLYRFFPGSHSECDHEKAVPRWRTLAPRPQTGFRSPVDFRQLHPASGRHSDPRAQDSRGWMLLPLRGIAIERGVREDVRFEELRGALVDEDLR
jgi:hypothetical protein